MEKLTASYNVSGNNLVEKIRFEKSIAQLQECDAIELLVDIPQENLKKGDSLVVLIIHKENVFEVENERDVFTLKIEPKDYKIIYQVHPALGKVYINETQYFDNVPELAWNFYIGGYQPAQKWLKDRKGRELTFDDIIHYQKIVYVLTETARLMGEVDKF